MVYAQLPFSSGPCVHNIYARTRACVWVVSVRVDVWVCVIFFRTETKKPIRRWTAGFRCVVRALDRWLFLTQCS